MFGFDGSRRAACAERIADRDRDGRKSRRGRDIRRRHGKGLTRLRDKGEARSPSAYRIVQQAAMTQIFSSFADRKFVVAVHRNPVPHIEDRIAVRVADGDQHGIRERGISGQGGGCVVERMRPRVCHQVVIAMAEPFFQLRLKRVVIRIGHRRGELAVSEVRKRTQRLHGVRGIGDGRGGVGMKRDL